VSEYFQDYYDSLYRTKGTVYQGLTIILFFLVSFQAWAKVTLEPVNGGSLGFVSNGTVLYYFVSASGPSAPAGPAFFPKGISALDISQTSQSDSNLANVFQFNFYSDKTQQLSNSQQLVIIVQAGAASTTTPNVSTNPTASSPSNAAPIASAGGVPCNSSICQDFRQDAITTRVFPSGAYYAAKYTAGSTVSIGIYPSDVCSDYYIRNNAPASSACSASGVGLASPSLGTPTIMPVNFSLYLAPDQTSPPTGASIDSLGSVGLTLQVDTPTFNCPSQAALNNAYNPGDGQMSLDTSQFTLTTPPAAAPAYYLTVVGQLVPQAAPTAAPTPPVVDSTFTNPGVNNFVASQIPYGSNQNVGPLLNSTSTASNNYYFSFILQDAAGIFAPPASSCQLGPVQVAAIQGYLGKSNCFIATAAFGSVDRIPVVLLREFRDRLLLPSYYGAQFVKWYYRWSPNAAEWIASHPLLRLPVLLKLAPVEGFAWFSIHFKEFLIFLSFFEIFSITILVKSRKWGEELE
jgi:hypothetical protein